MLLYDKIECPFCFKIRIALEEQGRDYRRYAHDDPEVVAHRRRVSPSGTVPILLIDEGRLLTDSAVIQEYLADTGEGLLSDEPWQRAVARGVTRYSDAELGPRVRGLIFEKRDKPESEWDWRCIEESERAWKEECLPWLDERLGDQAFFSDDFSLAEAALGARFGLAYQYGLVIPESFPRLHAWLKRVVSRPAYSRAAPKAALGALMTAGFPVTSDTQVA